MDAALLFGLFLACMALLMTMLMSALNRHQRCMNTLVDTVVAQTQACDHVLDLIEDASASREQALEDERRQEELIALLSSRGGGGGGEHHDVDDGIWNLDEMEHVVCDDEVCSVVQKSKLPQQPQVEAELSELAGSAAAAAAEPAAEPAAPPAAAAAPEKRQRKRRPKKNAAAAATMDEDAAAAEDAAPAMDDEEW